MDSVVLRFNGLVDNRLQRELIQSIEHRYPSPTNAIHFLRGVSPELVLSKLRTYLVWFSAALAPPIHCSVTILHCSKKLFLLPKTQNELEREGARICSTTGCVLQ